MRMRKKKNSDTRLSRCEKYLYSPTLVPHGEDVTALVPMAEGTTGIYLEIGAGKGRFACEMARRHSDKTYFAMERCTDCVVLGAERAASGEYGELNNLRFIIDTADNLLRMFPKGSVDAVLLNFSDPWTKKGYAKRRLTHRRYLATYLNLLRDGGTLTFKTDNNDLFDFSVEEVKAMGLTPTKLTRDLHNSEWNEGNIMTEYEENFSSQGMSINMLEFVKPAGMNPPIDPSFLKPSYLPSAEGIGDKD